jgi:hypothetical protein
MVAQKFCVMVSICSLFHGIIDLGSEGGHLPEHMPTFWRSVLGESYVYWGLRSTLGQIHIRGRIGATIGRDLITFVRAGDRILRYFPPPTRRPAGRVSTYAT